MRKDDVAFTAALHHAELPHGFFPKLGAPYLRAYHHTYVTSPHSVALVVEDAGRPCGFLVGTVRHSDHNRFVVRTHGLRLSVAALRAMLTRPRLAVQFVSTRLGRYVRSLANHLRPTSTRGGVVVDQAAVSSLATLSHVAVTPDKRTNGVGSLLVNAFADAARTAQCHSTVLSTLAEERGAADFYARLGWVESGRYVDRDGQPWVRMTQPL